MAEDLAITDALVIPAADLDLSFSRSGGPGGQHVNTTDTKVRLRFALDRCAVLSQAVKNRIRADVPSQVTGDGELMLACDTHRSRLRNIEGARDRLAELIRRNLEAPKRRKKTRPSRAAKRRRLDAKKRRGQVKKGRGRVRED